MKISTIIDEITKLGTKEDIINYCDKLCEKNFSYNDGSAWAHSVEPYDSIACLIIGKKEEDHYIDTEDHSEYICLSKEEENEECMERVITFLTLIILESTLKRKKLQNTLSANGMMVIAARFM